VGPAIPAKAPDKETLERQEAERKAADKLQRCRQVEHKRRVERS